MLFLQLLVLQPVHEYVPSVAVGLLQVAHGVRLAGQLEEGKVGE